MNKQKAIALIVIVFVVLSGLYLGGFLHGRSRVKTQRDQCLQQLKDFEARLAGAENQAHFFKARIALYQTAFDLDQRNFGLANAHLREADEPLAKLNPEALRIDRPTLDALRQEIAKTNIQVAIDLEVQRNQILNFERRLDSLIPRSGPSLLPTAPSVPPMTPSPAPAPPTPATPETPENPQPR